MSEQMVIIAIDHSPQALNAVKFYLEKMHRQGNKLIFVHCIELPNISEARDCTMSPGVLASLWKEEEARTKRLEEKLKALLKDKNIAARLRNVRGKPGDMLCQIAADEKAACVVIGSRGMGAIKKKILGSVSDHVLKHSQAPVIVCRENEIILESGETQRNRHSSEKMSSKSRHSSGAAIPGEHSLASNLRRRFASGTGASMSLSEDVKEELQKMERNVILFAV